MVEATTETMWDYLFQAKHPTVAARILACNSREKLQREVRNRGWPMAWITTTKGMMSYGQNVVHEYPYTPRY